jgi:glycosyltransferase involved in cell wall biosynthesis
VLHPRFVVTPKIGMSLYGRSLAVAALPVLRRVRSAFPFDVIDAHYLYPDGYAAVLAGRRLGVPVVLSARGTDAHTYPEMPLVRGRIRRALRGAARVVAVSRDLAERVRSVEPTLGEVTVIPNGVDTRLFRPADRDEARRRLGFGTEGRLVLAVGRLEPVKGHELLLKAFADLVGEDGSRELRLVLAGDGARRSALEQEARDLGIETRVTFAGEVPHGQLADWYAAADLVCLPSRREGWPNVLMEAMACGTPSVSARVGGAPEILEDEALGILAAADDAHDLSRALREGLARPWDRSLIAARAAERSWERTAERIEELLASVHADSVSP